MVLPSMKPTKTATPWEGYLHCYSPGNKRFIKISKGQKAYIIDNMDNDKEKCLIYTWDGYLVEIYVDEIFAIGFD